MPATSFKSTRLICAYRHLIQIVSAYVRFPVSITSSRTIGNILLHEGGLQVDNFYPDARRNARRLMFNWCLGHYSLLMSNVVSLSHRFTPPLLGICEESLQLFFVSPLLTNGALRDGSQKFESMRYEGW